LDPSPPETKFIFDIVPDDERSKLIFSLKKIRIVGSDPTVDDVSVPVNEPEEVAAEVATGMKNVYGVISNHPFFELNDSQPVPLIRCRWCHKYNKQTNDNLREFQPFHPSEISKLEETHVRYHTHLQAVAQEEDIKFLENFKTSFSTWLVIGDIDPKIKEKQRFTLCNPSYRYKRSCKLCVQQPVADDWSKPTFEYIKVRKCEDHARMHGLEDLLETPVERTRRKKVKELTLEEISKLKAKNPPKKAKKRSVSSVEDEQEQSKKVKKNDDKEIRSPDEGGEDEDFSERGEAKEGDGDKVLTEDEETFSPKKLLEQTIANTMFFLDQLKKFLERKRKKEVLFKANLKIGEHEGIKQNEALNNLDRLPTGGERRFRIFTGFQIMNITECYNKVFKEVNLTRFDKIMLFSIASNYQISATKLNSWTEMTINPNVPTIPPPSNGVGFFNYEEVMEAALSDAIKEAESNEDVGRGNFDDLVNETTNDLELKETVMDPLTIKQGLPKLDYGYGDAPNPVKVFMIETLERTGTFKRFERNNHTDNHYDIVRNGIALKQENVFREAEFGGILDMRKPGIRRKVYSGEVGSDVFIVLIQLPFDYSRLLPFVNYRLLLAVVNPLGLVTMVIL
jgi:hypothetical protein